MINRIKKIKNSFYNYKNLKTKESVKFKCIQVGFIQRLEYMQSFTGRCISYRSKKKISSVTLRNKKYGVEARFILGNPRLVICH
jgi:hypothetical protein